MALLLDLLVQSLLLVTDLAALAAVEDAVVLARIAAILGDVARALAQTRRLAAREVALVRALSNPLALSFLAIGDGLATTTAIARVARDDAELQGRKRRYGKN